MAIFRDVAAIERKLKRGEELLPYEVMILVEFSEVPHLRVEAVQQLIERIGRR